jgi:NLP/P60 family protein
MKKIILLSLMLACQSLYAAPAGKAPVASKTAQSSSVKKVAPAQKNAKSGEKKAEKPAAKKPPSKAPASKTDDKKKDKTEAKKSTTAKTNAPAKKPDKANKKPVDTQKKAVAQKSEGKREKNGKTQTEKKTVASKTRETATNSSVSSARTTLLNHGKKFIGTPYVWGGSSPKGFDCSGLVQYLYQKQGITIPRNSREQFSRLPVASTPQPGDLVFFRRNGVINHVALYLGNGKMLHAPQTGMNVRIDDMERPNWKRRYAGARRAFKGEKTVIVASTAQKKDKAPNDKRVAKRAPTTKEKSKAKKEVRR